MKKVLSLILAVCMLASFAMVASAALPATINVHLTETETGATADIVLSGDVTAIKGWKLVVQYDGTKLDFVSDDAAAVGADWQNTSASWKTANAASIYCVWQNLLDNKATTQYVNGTDVVVATLTFNKIGEPEIKDGDVKVIEKYRKGAYWQYTSVTEITDAENGTPNEVKYATGFTTTFTPYEEEVVVDPAVTTESADVTIVADDVVDGTANYTATAAVKFGKKATLYANGEVIIPGNEYAATEATVITVEYVDDDTAAVYASAKVYSAAGEGAVFAKATNGATDCGFIIEAFKYKNFNDGTYMNDAKFAAANVVDGVFGIMLTNVAAGSYEAVPYAGADLGAAVNLEVE